MSVYLTRIKRMEITNNAGLEKKIKEDTCREEKVLY
jgi:hypothetical protein